MILLPCIRGHISYNTVMQPEIAQQLLELNHQFYQTFADDFSETRQRLQPGVIQAVASIPPDASLLDLGCGNGLLAAYLNENGHQGRFVGIDTSPNLIDFARQQNLANAVFFQADLAETGWIDQLEPQPFNLVVCFAVLHHIPSVPLRIRFLQQVRSLLLPDGLLIHSNWQFLNSPRLKARIQAWEQIGLTDDQVDEHDYLMDWRRGGTGLRYVHFFSSAELHLLASQTGFQVKEEFTSDGASGNLGLYQFWQPNPESKR